MKRSLPARQDVSRETGDRLACYLSILKRWNAKINLISRGGDDASIWTRHFEDALQLRSHMPLSARQGLDMGSGAGFPGLVLAIASNVHFHLVEADRRKAAFLQEVTAATSAPATIHASRIEDVKTREVDVLTARALAPLNALLNLGARFIGPDGVALFLKGRKVDAELVEAEAKWRMTIARYPSETDPSGAILKLSGLSNVHG